MGNLPSITTESGLRLQNSLSKTELDRIDRRVGGELTLTDVHRHCQIPEGNPFLSRMFEMYSDGHGYITTNQMQSLLATISRLGPDKIGQLQCEYIDNHIQTSLPLSFLITDHHKLLSLLPQLQYSLTSTVPIAIFSSKVAFCILDQDNDGYVTEEDILHYLLLTVADKRAGLSRGQLEQIVKATVLHHDIDKDGRLNQLEFESLFS